MPQAPSIDQVTAVPQVDVKPLRLPGAPGKPHEPFTTSLLIAVWFGMFAGLVEGCEFLLFQRINWKEWAVDLHFSKEILWTAPTVDVAVCGIIVLLVAASPWVRRRNLVRSVVWILVSLTTLDLLDVTRRFTVTAMVLLALGAATCFDRWWIWHRRKTLAFWKKSCPWLLATWMALFICVQGGRWAREEYELATLPDAARGSPNIVFIVIDTLRADHVSAYGYNRRTTPNIDRIAKEGVLFENAISAASWTYPSHASMLTGRYPSEHGLQDLSSLRLGSPGLRGFTTLGDALQAKGYRTGGFSANHVFFTSSVGLAKGFIHFEDYFWSPKDVLLRTSFGRRVAQLQHAGYFDLWRFPPIYDYKAAPEVNREALQWIGNDQRRPFFVFLNYFGVHQADDRSWEDLGPAWGIGSLIDRYDSAITFADARIGELMTELQNRGLLKNTIVIITSDHGQGLGQHEIFGHASTLYLAQSHVPLVIWYPGHAPAGVRIPAPVSNAALAATIMNLLTGHSDPFTGSELSSFWSGTSTPSAHPDPISQLAQNDIMGDHDRAVNTIPTAADGNMEAILTAHWHLIAHTTRGMQLYDVVNDPGEFHDLINTPEGAAVAHKLEVEMNHAKSP